MYGTSKHHHWWAIQGIAVWVFFTVLPNVAGAAPDPVQVREITADWKCQWCPYEDNAQAVGEVEAGVGYVTNDSYKHGDYTGLNEKGAYGVANLTHNYQSPDGFYTDVTVSDAGLDSRAIELRGGMNGTAELGLDYSELPKLTSDSARTPYQGNTYLQRPGGWTPQPNTQDMTQLASALHDVDLMTERRSYGVYATYYQTPQLFYGLSFQRDSKDGKKSAGLALGDSFAAARSAILAVPVDYLTNLGEATINYSRARWQMAVKYQFSKFENDNTSVQWENAFSLPGSVSQGQAALEPDNKMQQVSLRGSYQLFNATQLTGLLATGRMEQDVAFLPYTVNGALSPAALPRSSLGGEVNTFDASVGIYSRVNQQVNFQAQYQQHEQDNNTPRATYNYVIADTSISGNPRANIPYGFRQRKLQLEGDYRPQTQQKFTGGYDYQTVDRTYQEVETTTEHGVWGRYKTEAKDNLHLAVRLERSRRDGDSYQPVTEIVPAENPLLRNYNLADRTRDKASITILHKPRNNVQLDFVTEYAKDDYSDSDLGLQQSEQTNFSVGLQYQMTATMQLTADYTLSDITSRQAGSFAATSWSASNDESVDVAHLGLVYRPLRYKLTLGLDYTYADSTGQTTITTGDAFPDLTSKRHTLTLYGDYDLGERSVLHVYYRYEDYREENWAIDGVAPNSIPRVLTMGEVSPDYSIGLFAVTLRYRFE
jgi:MtrB/PioB family decaheme-associated outer membrane protein